MTSLPEEHRLPMMDQAALAWGAIKPLERRGVIIDKIEIGPTNKPVIHVVANKAALDLKGAESHVTFSQGEERDRVVMITDYRGCAVQWIEPRYQRYALR